MSLTREEVKIAYANVYKKCGENKLPLLAPDTKALNETLEVLKNKYSEGQEIESLDLNLLAEMASDMLDHMTRRYLLQVQKENRAMIRAPENFVALATDYIYLLAMDKLGCPDIPVCFNRDVQNKMVESARAISRPFVHYTMNKDDTFRAQRGKDANIVRSEGVNDTLAAIKNGRVTPGQVGQLVADYQALRERQRRHTVFWRFFHKDENRERQALLNEISTALKGTFPKINIDTEDPARLAAKVDDYFIKLRVDGVITDRFVDMKTAYGIEQSNELLNGKEHVFKKNDFNVLGGENHIEQQGKSLNIQPPIQEKHEQIDPSVNEFSIL